MKSFCSALQKELDSQIQLIWLETGNTVKATELSINDLLSGIERLKKFMLRYKFKNDAEEIYFFKIIKPQFISKLIYYNRILNIEIKKPYGGDKVLRKYLHNELDKLKRFFDNNLEFYKYYRTNSTYLDHKYFIRGKHDIKLGLDTFYFEVDHRFCTSHDYKVAKIIAHDLVQVYIEDLLALLKRKDIKFEHQEIANKLSWTENKTSLIELIYALHTINAFDKGNAEIKTIATYFESIFSIDLGDYYHTYLELRLRKTTKTKFIDALKENLTKRMDEQDDKE